MQATTTKLLLSISTQFGWKFQTIDIKNAFLNGTHQGRKVYLYLPQGFRKPDVVCEVVKSIYGLKTAAITWYLALREALESLNFQTSKHDECLFIRGSTYVTVHVDDLGVYNDVNNEVVRELESHFKLTSAKGDHLNYLGMEIQRVTPYCIQLSQRSYTQSILDDFNSLIRQSSVPISSLAPYGSPGSAAASEIKRFQRVIGKLIYLSCNTRPDIHFAVIYALGFANKPSKAA